MKHTFIITIEAYENMGLDDPSEVKDLIEESLRDSGMDNGADINVAFQLEKES